jgi:hypothetical protein
MSDVDRVAEEMAQDLAKAIAAIEKSRASGTSMAIVGPEAAVLVSGYDRVFVEEATRSALRSREGRDKSDSRLEAGGAAAAILCSVAACESYVSEYIARVEQADGKLSSEMEGIRKDPDALRQWKDLLAQYSKTFSPGESKEYLALGCLFQVRDLVAHRNARTIRLGTFPAALSDCVRQRIVPVHKAKNADWTSVLFVAEVAEWAEKTARAWIAIADRLLPEPRSR